MKSYNDEIAQMFIKAMEEGTAPWQRPWSSSALSPKKEIEQAKRNRDDFLEDSGEEK